MEKGQRNVKIIMSSTFELDFQSASSFSLNHGLKYSVSGL